MKFEYSKEMDQAIGKQPNVVPKFLASSEAPSAKSRLSSSKSADSSPRTSRQMYSNNDDEQSTRYDPVSDFGNINRLFSDYGLDDELETAASDSQGKSGSKGKPQKEHWEETVERQDRYHNDMMKLQRESIDSFNNIMMKILDKL